MKPDQKVILYTGGIRPLASQGKEEKMRDANGKHKAKKHPGQFMACPECGVQIKIGTGKPHRMRRPNNFLNCPFRSYPE